MNKDVLWFFALLPALAIPASAQQDAQGKECVSGSDPVSALCSTGSTTNWPAEANRCTKTLFASAVDAHLEDTNDPKQQEETEDTTDDFITSWPCHRTWNGPNHQIGAPNGYYSYSCRDEDKVEESKTWKICK